MTKLAPVLHKFSVSWSLTDLEDFALAYITEISPANHICHCNRLEANTGGNYLKKASPNPTKLAYFGAKFWFSGYFLASAALQCQY